MAELFLARDTERDELIVIKRILPYLSQEPEFVQMFLDEARIASQLHHPNIVQLHELGHLEGSIFIAMEYLDGVDLRKILQEEQKRGQVVPVALAAWIAARICEGLHYAHNRVGLDGRPMGIIHRDVSPQNVMVGFDGRVKLVDFGIAKASTFMERSKPGVIKGKFLYLAPEQLSQERVDHRADLFALGTMLYETTTGKSPFYKNTTEAVIMAIRSEDPSPPHLIVPGYPEALSRIVMRCLARDRQRRYQQADEIAKDLDAFCATQTPMEAAHLAGYVSAVFGDEGERTVLHIPQPPELAQAPAPVPLDDSAATAAEPRPKEAPTKPTAPISARPLPQGRRATGERNAAGSQYQRGEDPRTQLARPDDLKKALGSASRAAPAITPPPQRRASQVEYRSAGAPPNLEQGPTGSYTGSVSETPSMSLTPSTAAERPQVMLGEGPVFDTAPLPPEPRTRSDGPRARRAAAGPGGRARLHDEDDDESTVDYGTLSQLHEPQPPSRTVPRRIILGALAVGAMIVVAAATIRVFRDQAAQLAPVPEEVTPAEAQPPPEPAKAAAQKAAAQEVPAEAPAEAKEPPKPDPAPAVAKAAPPSRVPVVFLAPRGARISAGKANFTADRTYRLWPGTLKVAYRCSRRSRLAFTTLTVEAAEKTQYLRIPCR